MNKLNNRQLNILEMMKLDSFSSSGVFSLIKQKEKISLVTIKRDLEFLFKNEYLKREGKGRSVIYCKTIKGLLFSPVSISDFNNQEPDKRDGMNLFNFSLFKEFPKNIFSEEEMKILSSVTSEYKKKTKDLKGIVYIKELERFIIELSWKSSEIEGNTYTLLDTERLIKDGIPAKGHSKNEATMILNHKKAFSFILENLKLLKNNNLTLPFIEKVHELIVKDLDIRYGIRNRLVGIVGTKYKPLDNKYQIKESLELLLSLINKMNDSYNKALTFLVGFSYIQPFEDGNKRTSRLLCNAILLLNNCAPLSYRSVNEKEYRESILVFYEMNSIISMKKIFIEQYLFSANNYSIS